MVTLSELWVEAERQNPSSAFNGKDYFLMALSAAGGATVSTGLTYINFLTKTTGFSILDYLLNAIILATLVCVVFALFFGTLRKTGIFLDFVKLIWKRKEV